MRRDRRLLDARRGVAVTVVAVAAGGVVVGLAGGRALLLPVLLWLAGGRRRGQGGSASWGPATTCCCQARPGDEAAVRCFTLSENAGPDQDMDELCWITVRWQSKGASHRETGVIAVHRSHTQPPANSGMCCYSGTGSRACLLDGW